MEQLNTIQLDALREISNIGVGNAATSLSNLLSRKIDITVPSINSIRLDKLMEDIGESIVVGIVVKEIGEIEGNILIIFDKNVAEEVISNLTGTFEDVENMSSMGESVMCEIGNILSSTYMCAISRFTGFDLKASVPAVACDMMDAIVATCIIESGQYDDYVLDIETLFLDNNSKEFGAHFYYIPVPEAVSKLMKKLGIN